MKQRKSTESINIRHRRVKIEAVSTAYNNALLSVIHTRLQKQGKEEVIHTDQKIQDAMNAVSLDTKRQLQSALMPKEFSGRCIGRILRLERSTSTFRIR